MSGVTKNGWEVSRELVAIHSLVEYACKDSECLGGFSSGKSIKRLNKKERPLWDLAGLNLFQKAA